MAVLLNRVPVHPAPRSLWTGREKGDCHRPSFNRALPDEGHILGSPFQQKTGDGFRRPLCFMFHVKRSFYSFTSTPFRLTQSTPSIFTRKVLSRFSFWTIRVGAHSATEWGGMSW